MHTWETPHSPGAGEKQTTHHKTLTQVQQELNTLKNNQHITLQNSRVEYDPNSISSLFKYDYKPYRLTVWYKENHG